MRCAPQLGQKSWRLQLKATRRSSVLSRRNGLWGKGLASGTEGDAVGDRVTDEIVNRGLTSMIDLEVAVVHLTDQQASRSR